MLASLTPLRVILFIPLFFAGVIGLASLLMRAIRLARFPGFGVRYDRELAFLNRELRLLAAGIVLLFVLVPAGIGVALIIRDAGGTAPLVASRDPEPGSVGSAIARESDALESPAAPSPAVPAPSREPTVAAGTAPPASMGLAPDSGVGPPPHERPPADREIDPALLAMVPAEIAQYAIRTPTVIGPAELASGVWQQRVEPVDALFIHAHPDDESLDFAVLMAALARGGLRIATLLLTDGESGIDRYPNRTVPAGYPPGRLAGEVLRPVRVEETRRALMILGSDYYLHLGLRNHPYNRRADELPLDAIMAAWGGEETAVNRVRAVIAALAPRLVVAPDEASEAREHFEHEATGHVVRRAIAAERAAGRGPAAYLVSVDPFQREFYPDAVAVPRDPWGEDLRAVQGAALSQHHTQADASVIGIRRLLDLPFEYYRVIFWELEESLDELLGVIERSETTPR